MVISGACLARSSSLPRKEDNACRIRGPVCLIPNFSIGGSGDVGWEPQDCAQVFEGMGLKLFKPRCSQPNRWQGVKKAGVHTSIP